MRTLYHGSKDRITAPKFGFGKRHNDYGLGFYCTEAEPLAMEWAVAVDHDGWANRYIIDERGLSILNLNDPQYCILHWLAVLLENRQFETEYGLPSEAKAYLLKNFSVPHKESDVVIGYRADDSYFSFAQDFISGAITYRQLSAALRLGELGNQYVLKSERAFKALKFDDALPALRKDWLLSKERRDKAARHECLDGLRKSACPATCGSTASSTKGSLAVTSAYDRSYLYRAQKSLGRMLDFAVHELGLETEAFWTLFLESGVADGFGRGESRLLAGMSGIELAYEVLDRTKTKYRRVKKPVCRDEKGPEYWAAWALAHYQWLRGLAFAEIDLIAPIKVVVGMYSPYHEMDISQFVDEIDRLYRAVHPETNLRRMRERFGISQGDLASISGVSVRTIQEFEQRRKDINKAQLDTVYPLAQALCTTIESLVERVP